MEILPSNILEDWENDSSYPINILQLKAVPAMQDISMGASFDLNSVEQHQCHGVIGQKVT